MNIYLCSVKLKSLTIMKKKESDFQKEWKKVSRKYKSIIGEAAYDELIKKNYKNYGQLI